jgi:16S rRNA (uracil1498-N3)-methyltransferase
MTRIHCAAALTPDSALSLPPGAARHVQVLRMQPGDALTLFDGRGGEYTATIERIGRSAVEVRVGGHAAIEREAARRVHLAIGMPANERMDWLVEKAAELGAASIQPLLTAHGVLRLAGERADRKRAHWEAIAVAACEQCGRNRVPVIHPVAPFSNWLAAADAGVPRFILSLAEGARPLRDAAPQDADRAWVLSGPEGGLSAGEEQDALARGFIPLSLGARILRAETAALTALALLLS